MATPGERIAEAIDRLRGLGIAVNESRDARAVRLEVNRPAYRLTVYVDPTRFVGLEFDLLAGDGASVLHYFVDTDLYAISQPRHAWFLAEITTDIVVFLNALADGGVLASVTGPRPSMILPAGDGLVLVKRTRFGTTVRPYRADIENAVREGFVSVPS